MFQLMIPSGNDAAPVLKQVVLGTRLRPLYITRCGANSIHLPAFTFVLSWRQKIGINNKIIVIIVVQIIIINAVIVIIRAIFIIIVIAFNGSSIIGCCVCTSAGADLYDISTGCISPLLPRTCRCHDL